MARNHRSAKAAGSAFERQVADYLRDTVDDRIDRRVRTAADKGDIAGLRHMGGRVTVECKNTTRHDLGRWAAEVEVERGNDDGLAGIIAHKRHGKGRAEDQWVTMTLGDFVALLTGSRAHLDKESA